jgi:hypothetical protein
MTTFTIDSDNNITAFAELPAGADHSFSSEKEFAKLTANWPAARLVDTWNSFAGVAPFDDLKPVQKFKDRKVAVARIWKAVQRLSPTVAPQLPQEEPKAAGAVRVDFVGSLKKGLWRTESPEPRRPGDATG